MGLDIGVELCTLGARPRVEHFCYFCRLRSRRGGHALTQRMNAPTRGACRLDPVREGGWKPVETVETKVWKLHADPRKPWKPWNHQKRKRSSFSFSWISTVSTVFVYPCAVSTLGFHGFHGFHQQGHLGSSAWLVRGGSAWPDPAGQVSPCGAVGGGLHVARDSVRPRLPSALPRALPMRRKRDLRQ